MESKNSIKKFPFVKFILSLTVIYLLIWLWNDWIGLFVTLAIFLISFFVLLISYIVEWLEKSLIPSWYYGLMWSIIITSLALAGFYLVINGFEFDWQNRNH